jgi:hypothetical protein
MIGSEAGGVSNDTEKRTVIPIESVHFPAAHGALAPDASGEDGRWDNVWSFAFLMRLRFGQLNQLRNVCAGFDTPINVEIEVTIRQGEEGMRPG